MSACARHYRAERLASIEGLLRRTLDTLATTQGRAAVDQRSVGASRYLVEEAIRKLALVRDDVLDPFPVICGCGSAYDAREWAELDIVGEQDDGYGGVLELRNCVDCGSTKSIQKRREVR